MLNTRKLHCYGMLTAYLIDMPNKRHPAKKFIGFWATAYLKKSLKGHAKKKKLTLSVLIEKVLREFAGKIILLKKRNEDGLL